jgi:hypothetical protein
MMIGASSSPHVSKERCGLAVMALERVPRHRVQRRIQKIQEPLHSVVGFASIFSIKAESFVWIDALASLYA